MKHKAIIAKAIETTSDRILEVKEQLKELPVLYVVMTNPEDGPSNSYIRQKVKEGERFGIEVRPILFTPDEIIEGLQSLSKDPNNKIIIQLPLGEGYPDIQTLQQQINPHQDVDGFSVSLLEVSKLRTVEDILNHPNFSPTAKGVLMLNHLRDPRIRGKKVNIIGKGLTSGLPIVLMYSQLGATVNLTNSNTSLYQKCNNLMTSDIIVSCAGVDVSWMNPKLYVGRIAINVGMRREDGVLKGDLDYEQLKAHAYFINPVLGSTGRLTTLNLILNCVLSQKAIEQQ